MYSYSSSYNSIFKTPFVSINIYGGVMSVEVIPHVISRWNYGEYKKAPPSARASMKNIFDSVTGIAKSTS